MAIGVRVGVVVGPRVGVAVGCSQDEIAPPSGAGDGPNGTIKVPMSAASFLATTGRNATHAYTCQEPSGNLIDQIGAMPLIPNVAPPLYSVPVPGWSRVGVGFNHTAAQRISVGAGVGPNPTATPVAMLVYFTMRVTAGANEMLMLAESGATTSVAVYEVAGALDTQCNGNFNLGTVNHEDGAVHAMLLTYDPAGSVNRYSDLERDDGTFGAGVLDGIKGLGAAAAQNSFTGEVLAFWILQGADAQFTALQAKTFLLSLGWAPPWAAP